MIVIRHKQTGKEITCGAEWYYKNNIDLLVYEIIEWDSVVELIWGKGISAEKMEKSKATNIINSKSAAMNYRMIDVPRPDRLPIQSPIYPDRRYIKNNPHTGISKISFEKLKNSFIILIEKDWIKLFIIAVAATIFAAYLIKHFM